MTSSALIYSCAKKPPNRCTLYYPSTTINYGKFTTGHYRRAAPRRWASVPPFSKTNTTMAAFVKLEYAGFLLQSAGKTLTISDLTYSLSEDTFD